MFLTRGRGKGANYKETDVTQEVQAIGMHKCQNFIGLHHFTGADWIAPLHGSRLGREVCWYHEDVLLKAYIALEDDHLANDCFIELDECLIQNLLANRELPTRALKTWKNLSVPRQVY